MRALTRPRDGWRAVDFSAATVSDPNSRLVSRSTEGQYERITITGGVAGATAEAGYTLIVPLLSPSGRHLQWGEVWSCTLRLRHDTTTAPALTSGLAVYVSLASGGTTLVGGEYMGAGYAFTASTVFLRHCFQGGSAASGSATTIVASVMTHAPVADTTANRTRLYTLNSSGLNISAERVAINNANGVGTEQPTGAAYLALSVCRIDTTAGDEAIDVAVDVLTSEAAASWLAA